MQMSHVTGAILKPNNQTERQLEKERGNFYMNMKNISPLHPLL